jgi:signal transduction histidine kinase
MTAFLGEQVVGAGPVRAMLKAVKVTVDAEAETAAPLLIFDDRTGTQVDFDLRESIGGMIRTLGSRAEAKGLQLTCKVMPDVPERVIGDPGRLCQVLVNLVANAIKFTDSGQIDVRVQADEWTEQHATVHFTVCDTGAGIPPEMHKTIFEAFRHAEQTYKREHAGFGLGLAISADIVQRMGGNLWVQSELGKGSTFHFTASLKLQARTRDWEYKNQVSRQAEQTG